METTDRNAYDHVKSFGCGVHWPNQMDAPDWRRKQESMAHLLVEATLRMFGKPWKFRSIRIRWDVERNLFPLPCQTLVPVVRNLLAATPSLTPYFSCEDSYCKCHPHHSLNDSMDREQSCTHTNTALINIVRNIVLGEILILKHEVYHQKLLVYSININYFVIN